MKDKICLVTGATSGIGKVTAEELAKQGATVILLARNEAKAQRTKEEIMNKTGNISIDIVIADLSSLKQIRAAAATINANYTRLDVLINNAGFIASSSRKVTADNNEETFAVNYLAPFLLTALLFDKLKASKEARIVNVSSAAHRIAKPDFDDLQMTRHYSPLLAYSNAKLFMIMFTRQLAKRLKQYPCITVNALHPGVIGSNFSIDSGGIMAWGFKLIKPFLLSSEKGAATTLYLATAPEAAKYSGLYFAKEKPAKPAARYMTPDNEKKIWAAGEQLTGIIYPV